MFTPAGFIVVGVLLMVGGVGLFWHGSAERLPGRTELTRVAGVVQGATKRWKEKHGTERDVRFEFDVATMGGGTTKLTLPQAQIGEQQATDIIGRPIVAMFRNNDHADIWEFSFDNTTLVDYETSRQKREAQLASMVEMGPYVAGGGAVLLFLGSLWRSRRRAQSEAA
jgi:hypothetical protein